MVRAGVCLILVSCGPGLPSTGTETDAGEASTAAATSTTTSGTGGEASTSASASTGTTAEPTTAAETGDSGGSTSSTTGSTTEPVDTSSGTSGGEPAHCCAEPDVANAEVVGTTPKGPVALTWAWYAIYGGECGGVGVYVFEHPSLLAEGSGPKLEIFIQSAVDVPGKVPAVFTVVDAQKSQAFVEGEVDVVVIDEAHRPWWCAPGEPVVITDARAELTFTLVAEGWDLTGKVEATYCPHLNVICP